MTVRINDALRNSQVDNAGDTTANSGTIKFYTGAQPATADTAASGTLLATLSLPADAFAAAAAGSAAKSGTWQATVTVAGTAGWARMANAGDTIRIDGDVGVAAEDYVFDVVIWEVDGVVTINTATLSQPAS